MLLKVASDHSVTESDDGVVTLVEWLHNVLGHVADGGVQLLEGGDLSYDSFGAVGDVVGVLESVGNTKRNVLVFLWMTEQAVDEGLSSSLKKKVCDELRVLTSMQAKMAIAKNAFILLFN